MTWPDEFTDPNALDELHLIIHDRWFDADALQFAAGIVRIPFASKPVWRASKAKIDSILEVHHAREYHIVDTEQVGLYDFQEILFDPSARRVIVTAHIPLKLEIDVDAFKLVVRPVQHV
jgi:hypothetical protein